MIDPEMVLAEVQQGIVPTTWRVYRGSGSPVGAGICLGLFALGFASVCGVMGVFLFAMFNLSGFLGATPPGPSGPSDTPPAFPDFDPLQFLATSGILLLLIALAIAILVGVLVGYGTQRAKDSFLALLPEGVVQCTACSDSARRAFRVLDYTDIVQINLRVSTTRYNGPTASTTPGSPVMYTSRSTRFWLDIVRRNGEVQRWPIDRRYRAPEEIAQEIIAGHARYTALHP